MKRIAVASPDGNTISGHFGRSACFIIFEVNDSRITRLGVRQNLHACGEHSGCGHTHEHGEQQSHAGLMAMLADCAAVIAGGMGRRAADELRQNGIEPVTHELSASPQSAVHDYVHGGGADRVRFCDCSH